MTRVDRDGLDLGFFAALIALGIVIGFALAPERVDASEPFSICGPSGAYDHGHPACDDERLLLYVDCAADDLCTLDASALDYVTRYCTQPGAHAVRVFEDGSIACSEPAPVLLPDTSMPAPAGLGVVALLIAAPMLLAMAVIMAYTLSSRRAHLYVRLGSPWALGYVWQRRWYAVHVGPLVVVFRTFRAIRRARS